VYKWVPGNLMLGVTLQWTVIPIQGELEILLHATETGVKRWPDGPPGPNADFTFLPHRHLVYTTQAE